MQIFHVFFAKKLRAPLIFCTFVRINGFRQSTQHKQTAHLTGDALLLYQPRMADAWQPRVADGRGEGLRPRLLLLLERRRGER